MRIKIDRDFSRNRSDKYQHLIVESSYAPDIIAEFFDAKGFGAMEFVSNGEYNDELYELRSKLKEELWRIMEEVLTERQFEVIKLSAQGLTQTEIAKKLNVNQSSVTKSINGNSDYSKSNSKNNGKGDGKGKRVYGGAKKKLKKAAAESTVIKSLLEQIAELESE